LKTNLISKDSLNPRKSKYILSRLKPSIDKYDEVNFLNNVILNQLKQYSNQEDIVDSDKKLLNKKSKIQICGYR
jgi:hypothetical protein